MATKSIKEKGAFNVKYRANFEYKKEDGSISQREIINPKFIKESYNYYDSVEKEAVKYVQGYEIDSSELTLEEKKLYQETLIDYFNLSLPTISEYMRENGLDPNKVKIKNFKKENISNFNAS
jgi:hypothetical protein